MCKYKNKNSTDKEVGCIINKDLGIMKKEQLKEAVTKVCKTLNALQDVEQNYAYMLGYGLGTVF